MQPGLATQMPPERVRVLLVEDDILSQKAFEQAMQATGEDSELRIAPSAEHAIRLMRDEGWRPSVVVIDERLPGISGSTLEAQILMSLVDPDDLVLLRWTSDPKELPADSKAPVLCKPLGTSGIELLGMALRTARGMALLAATAAVVK